MNWNAITAAADKIANRLEEDILDACLPPDETVELAKAVLRELEEIVNALEIEMKI